MQININNINMYVDVKGLGYPLILVHGNGEDHHIFDELVSKLKDQYTCYMIDSRNHGLSSKTDDFSYETMVNDIVCLIDFFKLDKPGFIGFSDGGIIGLIIGMKYPNLLSKMMVLGANIYPTGIKKRIRNLVHKAYNASKSPYLKMMIDEPNYTFQNLNDIKIPVYVIVGENDVIHLSHTKAIYRHLKHATLDIIKQKNHDNYVVHRDDLFPYIEAFFKP